VNNELPHGGDFRLVPDRTYELVGLVAEYAAEADVTLDPATIPMKPVPQWSGDTGHNPIAEKLAANTGESPAIQGFDQPTFYNNGTYAIIKFTETEGETYGLYISLSEDGRNAELLEPNVKNGSWARGLRVGVPMYFWLVKKNAEGVEAKPSAMYKLITEDKFKEK